MDLLGFNLILWKVGLFPAQFSNASRQSSCFLYRGNSYQTVLAVVLTNRLISIAYTVISRIDAVLCQKWLKCYLSTLTNSFFNNLFFDMERLTHMYQGL